MLVVFGILVVKDVPVLLTVVAYTAAVTFLAKWLQGRRIQEIAVKRRGTRSLDEALKIGFYTLMLSLGYALLLHIYVRVMSPVEIGKETEVDTDATVIEAGE